MRKVSIGEFENEFEGVLALVEAGSEIAADARTGEEILRHNSGRLRSCRDYCSGSSGLRYNIGGV